ncbi:hypothetical protein F511_12324 [Dorcoceras hygrometricum]|uniref:Uncharacterized protein n=1 Tax=Dorcoceras hygrometricum TaxID=472368 RepID=A0A2Z7BH88_9LAMI|nr:hypothetical protein F511_12324 [Dorcoceras hygrometricum]
MVSIQYDPFNSNIPIKSTIIGKSRVARDPITMHTSWRPDSDIACVTRISTHKGGRQPVRLARAGGAAGVRIPPARVLHAVRAPVRTADGHLRDQFGQVGAAVCAQPSASCAHHRARRACTTVRDVHARLPAGWRNAHRDLHARRARQARNAHRIMRAGCSCVYRDPRRDLCKAGAGPVRDWRVKAGGGAHGYVRWWRDDRKFFFLERPRFDAIKTEVGVLTDPSQGSDTTVGTSVDPDPAPGAQWKN